MAKRGVVAQTLMGRLYPELMEAHLGGDFGVLDESLGPRPPVMLLNLAGETGLDQGMLAIDVGCGRGDYAEHMARRHGCRVLGLDLALGNLQLAQGYEDEEWPEAGVYFGQATIEALPVQDGAADLIFCRDMLLHVEDLERSLVECGRALRPGGSMVVLATVTGELLSQQEAATLFKPIGIGEENLSRLRLEAAFSQAGLTMQKVEEIGGERLEHLEEEHGLYTRELMRLARMRRDPERYRQALGDHRYEAALALYTLSIYLLIGKLVDVMYWLRK